MNRIEKTLNQLRSESKKAFITYMTAGLPSMEGTKELIKVQEEAGTNIIELGVPFSDPVADGPVIQDASFESIKLGTNVRKIFQMVGEVRDEGSEIPIVFMLYFNTIMYYGIEAFIDRCIEVGVDGLIIPDLPFEEQGEINKYLKKNQAPYIIQLVAPVSKDRIPMLLKEAKGFVYCVSSMGVTGQQADFHADVTEYIKEVKQLSEIPIMMGFGIRTPEDVLPMRDVIDGAIVGSAFMKMMKENNYDKNAVKKYCSNFAAGLN